MNSMLYLGAALAGTIVGLAFDPVVIVAGVAVCAASAKWWQAVLAALALSIVLSFAIRFNSEFGGGMPLWWVMICRSIAILGWSLPILIGRYVFRRLRPAHSSSGLV